MKFDKSVYKAALDKVDNPEKRKTSGHSINQKYKSDVLSGKGEDQWAGWDASNKVYDDEMLKREYDKKMLICLPFIVVGIVALVAVFLFAFNNAYLKMNGTECKAYYGYSEDLGRHTYIFRWKLEGDNRTQEQIKEEKEELNSVSVYSFGLAGHGVNLHAIYSKDNAERLKELAKSMKEESATDSINAAIEEGIYPVDIFIYVNAVGSYSSGMPDTIANGKENCIPLYYLPQEGETVFDLRGVYETGYVTGLCLIVIIYNLIWMGRLIWLGKKQRAYN